ncbi:putative Mor domain-containing protein [Azospirillaceae bacterium]
MTASGLPTGAPRWLMDLASEVGVRAVLLLIRDFGGMDRRYIPLNPDVENSMRSLIGEEAWRKMVLARGGTWISIPKLSGVGRAKTIVAAAQDHVSAEEVAKAAGCTVRHVRRLRQLWRQESSL